MEDIEYETMYLREEDHWWYLGLRDLVTSELARLSRGREGLAILDAGCGTGKLLATSAAYRAAGLEFSAEACRFLRRRALTNVVRGTICRMPYRDGTFDVVVSTDVICCVKAPGDLQALREMGRVLRPGGTLLLNLPAYESLRSHHDEAVHTRQRYVRGQLREMLRLAGFQDLTMTYRNTLLFPVAALVRGIQKRLRPVPVRARSDLRPLPDLLNRLLSLPLVLENRLIRAGARLPFGLSLYCVAMKP